MCFLNFLLEHRSPSASADTDIVNSLVITQGATLKLHIVSRILNCGDLVAHVRNRMGKARLESFTGLWLQMSPELVEGADVVVRAVHGHGPHVDADLMTADETFPD